LLRGETGTGKELFARLVHGLSSRHAEPFVEVNCAAIPENLFEAELFGHEKGAFTGAERARSGHFENANRGTLFLDEVGELPLILQAKLLRVLQEQRIQRVGSSATREVDVRIVAASNRNLHHMVQQGSFREDLYYRLNVFEVEIPPLRERKEDVPALVEFFLNKYALKGHHFAPDALDQLLKYDFPGNVRELEHVVQRTTALSRTNVVRAQDLPVEITRDNRTENPDQSLCARVAEFEQRLLEEALADNGGVQVKAAAQLGISERVLRYKLAKYRTGSK
jgi:transcriptional regulator with PAS, ATPase and Fis domain